MSDDTPSDARIEYSPFCRMVSRDSLTVYVEIYRVPSIDKRWSLEVVDHLDASSVWDEMFDTDDDALSAFKEALEAEGIAGLTETFH
ncbi:hypothetical protein [Lichenibacterium ramalinae]|uniref:Uncharacterized protein n=1 Tax=Lichenibacterium ramalinae TaxID=2316527 RepID=A0A4Q2RHR1_9HYPH|nr:hypothetical protein [Lichenibacterium ramalinae]RYB07264.1 hypothetical protein D3272_04180 [Lichenibacterium ramalinae]